MFIHASDPERIQKELQQLSYQLADLVKQVDYLTRNIVTTSPRAQNRLCLLCSFKKSTGKCL